ncbi:hypothetical protein MKX01_018686 [Papaver californicum]|nr:hypothetical protein MKX01_018686 [Papaver californicum]
MESINNKERKRTSGRQKIEIKKIEDKAKLQVTFCKRKGGLFRKASELSILCGADVAIIVYSPAGKAFACGHPTPDHILDRFLNNGEATGRLSKIHKGDELSLCQQRYTEAQKELEVEKTKRERFLEMLINCNLGSISDEFLWDTYIDGLSLTELEKMRSDMEQLKKIVEKRWDERMSSTNVDSFSWLMTVPDSDVNPVDADFKLDGKLSNAASSSSSPMTAQDSDANTVAADDSSDLNPITVDDPFDFLNIDVPDLLEIEWC